MGGNRTMELLVGVFVLAGIIAIAWLALKVGNLSAVDVENAYKVTARFDNIGQLKVKAPITIGGVRVGRVSDIRIDKNFFAVVTLDISGQYRNIPSDTAATILTAGLLGEQYIALEPGGDETPLKQGDELTLTQSAFVLEKMISQFLYNQAEGGEEGQKK